MTLKKTVWKKICETRGDATLISGIMLALVVALSLAAIVSVSAIGPKAAAVKTAADNIADMVAQDGAYGQTEQQAATAYLNSAGLGSASVSCDHSGVIQEGTDFTITVKAAATFGIGGLSVNTVPVQIAVIRKSNVYTEVGA